MVAGNIGEGVHAVGGVERQLIDLVADVFGGLFGGHGSMLAKWPRHHAGAMASNPTALGVSRVSSFAFCELSSGDRLRCAAESARAAGDTLWAWDGRGVPPMD